MEKALLLSVTILLTLGFHTPLVVAQGETAEKGRTDDYLKAIEAWRVNRHERLLRPDGWLTLVGLEWLEEGENRIGSAHDNKIRLSGGPDHWGSIFLEGDKLSFVNGDTEFVTVDGETKSQAALTSDAAGEPTLIASGSISFYPIFRESYALRIKDSQAPALLNFKGVDNYPVDETWFINGRFVHAKEGTAIEISNVLGQINEMPVFGTFEFEKENKTHTLLGIGDSHSRNLWFIFADRTSGRGTYGAGRFLYSDGMPADGSLAVDFNKTYNPPCAFNPYSTCPLPPQENRLNLQVVAGEKDFHPDPG